MDALQRKMEKAMSDNLTDEEVEAFLTDEHACFRELAIYGRKLSKAQIDRGLNDPYFGVRQRMVMAASELTSEQVQKLLNDESWVVIAAVLYKKHPVTDAQFERLLTCYENGDDDEYANRVRTAAIKFAQYLTPEQLGRALTDTGQRVRAAAIDMIKSLTPEQLERALIDDAWEVRCAALEKDQGLSMAQIERGLRDNDCIVARAALKLIDPDLKERP